ncbi:MAG: hypothetical protein RLZZ538_274 [Actinomycetota bacterium]
MCWHDEDVKFDRPSLNAALDTVRESLGKALRDRVAGPNGEQRMMQLMNPSAPRWFTDDRPIRRVHADAAMFIGGLRALLVQSLHPLAMAGVAQHSDYRNDPWGRLQRTADFLATTSFGPADEAQRTIDVINRVHERVVGVASDGRPYSARDPHLLRWVHIVEIDSFLAAHQRFGEFPLDTKGCDEYVRDTAFIARKLGVPAPPESVRALRDQISSYRAEIHGTRESRDAMRYLLFEPPLPPVARAAYSLLVAATLSTLPRWSRPHLGLPYLPVTERFALQPLGDAITRAVRWAMPPRPTP